MVSVAAEIESAQRTLIRLADGDAAVEQELAELLAESLQRSTAGLVSAVAAGALRPIVQHAHAIRSTAISGGLFGVGELAERIECGAVPADELVVQVGELSGLIEHVITWLRGYPHIPAG